MTTSASVSNLNFNLPRVRLLARSTSIFRSSPASASGVGKKTRRTSSPRARSMPSSIEAGHDPAVAVGLGEMPRIDGDRVEMVGVHVVERRLFGGSELVDGRADGDEIVAVEQIGLAEAAIEAGALGLQPEDREIAEADIELGLGIAVEIAPLGARMLAAFRAPASPRGRSG